METKLPEGNGLGNQRETKFESWKRAGFWETNWKQCAIAMETNRSLLHRAPFTMDLEAVGGQGSVRHCDE